MNIVAIGMGNFGASLAKTLTAMGHDVLGVDKNPEKVEFFKDKISNMICLDASDPHALRLLPIKEADVFVVCIGDDFGVSVMISALLKRFGVKKVICRESSSIHLTVLNSIGIAHTINPEYESARILAQTLTLPGIHHLFNISETLKIVDLTIPASLTDQKFLPASFREKTHLKVVALRRNQLILYSSSQPLPDQEIGHITYQPNDILVLAGEIKDIRKFLNT
ncbi:MAG: K+ transport system NAD-binding [Prolixibacteraceae bacterium]|nr:MAG: K+ transport system NAD-binding [Prolixibacteraceae bacterium]